MKVTFKYYAQIRQRAGTETEIVELNDGVPALDAVGSLRHGPDFEGLLLDAQGRLQPTILLVVNGIPAAADQKLKDGDELSLFSPVAGG